MTNAQQITVGGVDFAVVMYDERHYIRRGRIAHAIALAPADWPISAAEIERRSNETFASYGCQPVRADATWAVAKAGDVYMSECEHYFFRALPNESEAVEIAAGARDEAEDGLV